MVVAGRVIRVKRRHVWVFNPSAPQQVTEIDLGKTQERPMEGDAIVWYDSTEPFAFIPINDSITLESMFKRWPHVSLDEGLCPPGLRPDEILELIDRLCLMPARDLPVAYSFYIDTIREEWLAMRTHRWFRLVGVTQVEKIEWRHPTSRHRLFRELITRPYLFYELSRETVEKICRLYRLPIRPAQMEAHSIARFIDRQEPNVGVTIDTLTSLRPSQDAFSLLKENLIVKDHETIYLRRWHSEECLCAQNVRRFLSEPVGEPIPIDWSLYPQLSLEQREAVKESLRRPISMITGGAGTGKTTIIKTMVEILGGLGKTFFLTSFTGKAVARLNEVIFPGSSSSRHGNERPSSTMHLAIAHLRSPKTVDYVFIDEISMVTTELFNRWIDRFGWSYRLVLIGDIEQLPPIGRGRLAEGLIRSGRVWTTRLTKNFRSRDLILSNSLRILKEEPLVWGDQFMFVEDRGMVTLKRTISALRERGGLPSSFTVITPYNVFCDMVNRMCQKIFASGPAVYDEKTKTIFRVGDKVRFTRNSYFVADLKGDRYDLSNGEEGVVDRVSSKTGSLLARFNGREFRITDLSMIALNYCITIHKAQGSEWDHVFVFVPAGKNHHDFVHRRLVYTAVTRAKKTVTVFGDREAFERHCQTSPPETIDNLHMALQ